MTNDKLKIYRCAECGKISTSLGWIHAHIEKHRGIFGLQLPWNIGDSEALMDRTETILVTDYEVAD